MNGNMRFILICLALFGVGGFLRYRSGWLTLPRPTETPVPSATTEPQEQLSLGLRETVFNFYEWIDRGYYKEAYQISLENKWLERGPDTYVRAGLTSQDEFISALNWEWRVNGTDLTIVAIDLLGVSQLEPDHRMPLQRQELYTLDSLPAGTQVEDIYQVEVGGLVIERCSTWEWDQKVSVAKLSTGEWKVLLPGIPGAHSSRVEAWFLGKDPFVGLDILPEK